VTIRRSSAALALLAAGLLVLVPDAAHAQKKQRDKITRAEIQASAHRELDLFQVIRALRPHFLEPPKGVRSIGRNSFEGEVAVYVDGKRDTGLDALKLIRPLTVEEVRYMEPTASATEFGPRVNMGALLIKMAKPPKDTAPQPAKDSLSHS
jgi:hypothetical protein